MTTATSARRTSSWISTSTTPPSPTPVDVMQQRIAELAAKGPVVYSTAYGGHWIVTRYKEIHEILTDTETFSSFPNNLVTPADFGKFIPLELDPPDHTAYRQRAAATVQPAADEEAVRRHPRRGQ